jgi:epoxyqueuosine reductase
MKINEAFWSRVQSWAQERGYRVAAADISLLEEVRSALEKRLRAGEIEPGFYQENLSSFTYLEGCPIKKPRSVILIAVPLPATILTFAFGGKKIETILPPTYVRYRKIFEDVRDDLKKAISGLNCRLELLSAPLKILANRMGLISYGRNNIGYIDGIGSYFQLVGLVSDKRFGKKSLPAMPAEPLLPRCRDCRICAAACPTGAIDRERILLHAEKCYTLFSESPNPIPEHLKPPSPRCLIGCLRCQELCPENKGLLRYEKAAVSFDEVETAAFLGTTPAAGPAFERAQAKFQTLGLTEGLPVFARNLKRMLRLFWSNQKDADP